MPIEFRCPSCQSLIRTPDGSGGKQARCPRCTATVVIPEQHAAVPEPSDPTPAAPTFNPPAAPSYTPQSPASNPTSSSNPFNNPFSDAYPAQAPGQVNPYAPSNYVPLQQRPITPQAARQRLLGPAIGLTASTLLCLAYAVFTIIFFVISPEEFMKDAPPVNQEAERIGFFFGMYAVMVIMLVAPLIVAAGTIAMYRGSGRTLAMVGAITSVLPCNPCCVIGLPFGIWALVVLNQADVKAAMS